MSLYHHKNLYSDFHFGHSITQVVKILIIVNIVMFIIMNIFRNFSWVQIFGLTPAFVIGKLMFWQPFTYMFVHGGVMHLVFNMLMLWWFGSNLEEAWGRDKFLSFYFFTGIGAALCSFIFYSSLTIGASGAIFGIFVAYAIIFPETTVLLFFIFPMKIKHLLWVLIGINLLSLISSSGDGVAYIAHLGGALFGYIYLKNKFIRDKLDVLTISNIRMRMNYYELRKNQEQKAFISVESDRILDKIARQGMESLNKREKDILERKSKGV